LFAPFGLLPLGVAAALVQVLSLAALAWSAHKSVEIVRNEGLRAPAWLAWLPLLCVLRLADSNLTNGQVNHFTLAAIVAAVLAWQRGRDRAAGAWIGGAAAFKLVPAIAALPWLARRRWRAFATAVFTSLAGVFLVPLVAFGPREGVDRLVGWWHVLLAPYAAGGDDLLAAREYVPGQSLTAALYRLLAATPATSQGASGPTAEIVALPPDTVKWIVLAVQIVLLAALVATVLRSASDDRVGARVREVCSCLCAGLLLAPLVHKAHMVWMLLPYALLFAGPPPELGPIARRARWILLVVSVLLVGATAPAMLGRALATGALTKSLIGCGVLLGGLALSVDVWAGRRTPNGAVPGRTPARSRSAT
jgi:alpha-1,2-mannosyltransferase